MKRLLYSFNTVGLEYSSGIKDFEATLARNSIQKLTFVSRRSFLTFGAWIVHTGANG